ncbi:hypothetical protein DSM112329_01703 [Paraconexibacter sp. AEG42_29]|uniref:DUF47 family protein n=1 Tax=Paraconexibacter sp. AEG42_29 TaxID=2997339 RepID=A0AAU7AT88_9ACTN
MRMPGRRADDHAVLELLEESGRNVQRTTALLHDLVRDYPERHELVADLVACEHEGDRITHDIIHRLHATGPRRRGCIETADGHALATALDDIVDFAEQASDTMAIYHIEAPMEQATALAEVLVGAGEQVARALVCLRGGADMAPHLVEIHRLENEGDRITRDAVASLFMNGIDPMVVIRWKDIFGALEASVDACETVAHVLEGISLRRR